MIAKTGHNSTFVINTSKGISECFLRTFTFDTVKEFIYLGSAVTTKNDVSLEIKRRITLANRCYYGLNGQLSNRDLSRTTKLILYAHPTSAFLWRRGMDIFQH